MTASEAVHATEDASSVPYAAAGLDVLVLAPTGRDAPLIVDALKSASIRARMVRSAEELVRAVAAEVEGGGAPRLGTIVAADDALAVDWALRLSSVLERQSSWSDLPIVLLARPAPVADERGWDEGRAPAVVAERLTLRGSVTVLDRPVRVATLVSAVRAALRARARQAEVRHLIDSRDRALAEAERASSAKGEFLAKMSHELRTPLNAIGGYVELILMGLRGPLTEEQRNDLERVRRNQRHLLGLINDVLNLARIESGRVDYRITDFTVAEVLHEVVPMIEPQLVSRQLGFERRLEDPHLKVSADREKLLQVLLNLLSNAVKFTPQGGRVFVDVVTEASRDGGAGSVLLRVSDTGVGIPAEKLESIFEPFVQVQSDSALEEGTGLGLAISRDLARGMGGDLSAQSTVGQGSTFTVTIPAAIPQV